MTECREATTKDNSINDTSETGGPPTEKKEQEWVSWRELPISNIFAQSIGNKQYELQLLTWEAKYDLIGVTEI